MGERKIDGLEGIGEAMKAVADAKATARAPKAAEPEPALVDVNYPEPTSIAKVVRDVSRWSGKAFVMEPRLDAKIQIFAPQRLKAGQAYDLFLASLSVLGLRAVQVNGVVKIVQVTPIVQA
jgi:general secretion pathway protein D